MQATYVSVWDDSDRVSTPCEFNPSTKVVTDIEDSGAEPEGSLTDEYVVLPDGTELRKKDGAVFEY